MVYLDYCATTPVDKRVLNTFSKVCLDYIGNSNSSHALGVSSHELEEYATDRIKELLKIPTYDVIYTSGASEANNQAIKGICFRYKNRGKHIITTYLEHSSVSETMKYMASCGFVVDYVKLDDSGRIDLEHFKKLINNDTVLVSISLVDSELGILQDIDSISDIIREYPKCFFHVDATQALGKVVIDFNKFDLASVSMHKIFGMKGIGMLIKRRDIVIDPIIHGGKSSTVYRSGTPALPLIASSMKAIDLMVPSIMDNYSHVKELSDIIKDGISKYDDVVINSSKYSISYVINFSLCNIKSETFVRAMSDFGIYISTKSACSDSNSMSDSVYAVTKNREYAMHSIRVSLSYLTTREEVLEFLDVFDKCFNKLNIKRG